MAQEFEILENCYTKSLEKAVELECTSIAFPLIATGVYGFPKDQALQIAISVFSRFLMTQEMQIILVVFDKKAFQLSRQMVGEIDSYIDANYVKEYQKSGYPGKTFGNRRGHYEREEDHRKRGKKTESSTTSQNNQNTHPGNPNSWGFSMPKCIPILQNKSFHPTPHMLK